MALLSAIVTFAATAFSSSMVFTLFVSRKTRAADLNDIKRWRVAAVPTALIDTIALPLGHPAQREAIAFEWSL
jgi:hypothetical protein